MMASVGLDKMVWIWDGQTFGEMRQATCQRAITEHRPDAQT